MIARLIEFSLSKRWLVIGLAVFICTAGIGCYSLLKIEAYPDISDTNVIIITQYNGRAAEEVEQQVTIPIERALNSVPHVISKRSRTIFGLSVIQLSFDDGTDDFYARQVVNEKLAAAELPDGVSPELGPLTTPVGEVFRYVVEYDDQYTPMEIRTIHDWTIKPFLLQTDGVADISPFGGPIKQFHVLTSPERLKRYDLTLKDIINSIEENNLNTGGSIVLRGEQGFAVRGIGAIRNDNDIEKIVITAVNGVPIYIRDVAKVEIAPPSPSGVLGYSVPAEQIDISSATEGIVLLRRGENASEVLSHLKEKIAELERNELPDGVDIRILYDRSNLVDFTIDTVSHTLLEGITIVVILLVLFLGSVKSAIVVGLTIPISLLFSFILMKITGIPANLLSLGAIDFGIIVDGACVMAAALVRKIKSANGEERALGIVHVTTHAAKEIGQEIFFTVLIIILAYLPLFTLQRVEGKLFSPMAYTLSFAVIGAMICALTIVPVLISLAYFNYFDKPAAQTTKKRWNLFHFVEQSYVFTLEKLMKVRKIAVAAILTALVVALGIIAPAIGTEFLPELDEGSVFARCFMPAGISIQENARFAPLIRKIIAHHTQVKNVITQTGRNDDGTDPFAANRTEILVELNNYSTWVSDTSKRDLINQIKYELETAMPGAYFSFGQPIIDQVTEVVTGSAADLAISIIGDDLPMMRAKADSMVQVVKNIRGASETGIEQEGVQAQLTVEINRENAARYGINVSSIQLMIEAAIGGKVTGNVYDGKRKYDILVRFLPEYRDNIDAIANMLVPAPSGARIPMGQLATIKLIDGQTNITRLDGKRLIAVRTNVRGRDQGSFVKECQKKIKAQFSFPKGYTVQYGGQFENLERASKRLQTVIPLTFLLVGLLLFLLYRNVKDTLITLSCIPFAVLGGLLALMVRGYNFNVSAGVGFVSLFGVSVMAGVLLVSAYKRSHTANGHLTLGGIVHASVHELQPIMMMLLVAIIGLLPAARSSGIGSDVQRPLATVIIGGLLTSLLLIPITLPLIYAVFGKGKENNSEQNISF